MRVTPRLSYVVCAAPRSGSSLLCAALANTGIAGRPQEYFDVHAHNEAFWREQLGITADTDYVRQVVSAGTTSNGVFGLKLHFHQAPALRAKLLADEDRPAVALPEVAPGEVDDTLHDLLSTRLGPVRYIWLRRRDVLAQAISYYRASQDNIWRVPAAGTPPAARLARFDYGEVHRHVQLVQSFDRAWHAFFMKRKLQALIVIYEDFVQNYEPTIRGVLRYLGQDATASHVPAPHYRRQSDAVTQDWVKRYLDIRKHGPEPRYTPQRTARPVTAKRPSQEAGAPLPLIAYDLGSGFELPISSASPNRTWMDALPKRYAYRCLPLVIGNQAGWMIHNVHELVAEWDGTPGPGEVKITYADPAMRRYAESHFGGGILTFSLGYLFRTPPGWNLHVRGPANWPKDGICALDAVVETDWTYSTFTMNWQLTRPNHPVRFAAGEPVAMISPVRRGDLERFRPEVQRLAADRAWHDGYRAWSGLRTTFNAALKTQRPEAVEAGWQRHYLLGLNPGDVPAPEHQTALNLTPFTDSRQTTVPR